MIKVIGIILLSIFISGCTAHEDILSVFNSGQELECGGGPFHSPEVVENINWKYSKNLKRFFKIDGSGDSHIIGNCHID